MSSSDLKDFDFTLPQELIAKHPHYPRDNCRLLYLHYNNSNSPNHAPSFAGSAMDNRHDNSSDSEPTKYHAYSFNDLNFPALIDYCQPGDLIILNNSRVLPAYLQGYVQLPPSGGPLSAADSHEYSREDWTYITGNNPKISVNLLKKTHLPLTSQTSEQWQVLAKPSRLLSHGAMLIFAPDLWAQVYRQEHEIFLLFNRHGEAFLEKLHQYGHMPLPPYLKRAATKDDDHDYQNIFATQLGSVAAPTAGLHFSDALLNKLREKGVSIAFVTLHVGGGTFLPIKTENLNEHKMHAEFFSLSSETAQAIQQTRKKSHRIIAVGTTVMRVLESIANGHYVTLNGSAGKAADWLMRDKLHHALDDGMINNNSAASDDASAIKGISGYTDIFIQPGFCFQLVNVLITNFHLPKSTLFVLLAAFAGLQEAHRAYAHAIAAKYRFFSYGDACLIERNLALNNESKSLSTMTKEVNEH